MQKYNPVRLGTAVVVLVLFIGVCLFPSTIGVDKPTVPTFTDPTIVSIQPPSQTVEVGDTFEISIYIEPSEPIIGANFDYLYFDETLIHANSVTFEGYFPGVTFPGIPTIDNLNGEIRDCYELIVGSDSISTSGSWVTISFTAQQEFGTSPINLSGVIISDVNGSAAPLEVNNGDVIVECFVDITMIHAGTGSGATYPPEGVTRFPCGTNITFTATPDGCSSFAGWSGDTTVFWIVMDGPKTVTATFDLLYYTLSTIVDGCGYISPPGGMYQCGTTVVIEANPCTGWEFAGWYSDHSGTTNPDTVVIMGDMDIGAIFCLLPTPLDEDINLDHVVHFLDLVAVSLRYNEVGPPDWIREDVNNDGKVHFMDLIQITVHYNEVW